MLNSGWPLDSQAAPSFACLGPLYKGDSDSNSSLLGAEEE